MRVVMLMRYPDFIKYRRNMMETYLSAAPAGRALISGKRTAWIVLFGRTLLFAAAQSIFAVIFWLSGSQNPWQDSAAWWPFTVFFTNLMMLAFFTRCYRSEGKSYWNIFRVNRAGLGVDLLIVFGSQLVAGPAGFLPNTWLASWLFGDTTTVLDSFIRPLPYAAVILGMAGFAITQGLTELPSYFAFCLPRLKEQGVPTWLAIALTSVMLGFQHMAIPLLFDMRFLAWRGLMFLPFALIMGILINFRPRLLPYYAAIHALMELSLLGYFLAVAY
jgi:hypothetical protein